MPEHNSQSDACQAAMWDRSWNVSTTTAWAPGKAAQAVIGYASGSSQTPGLSASGGEGGDGGDGGGMGGKGGGKQGNTEGGISQMYCAVVAQSWLCQPYTLSSLVLTYSSRLDWSAGSEEPRNSS